MDKEDGGRRGDTHPSRIWKLSRIMQLLLMFLMIDFRQNKDGNVCTFQLNIWQ